MSDIKTTHYDTLGVTADATTGDILKSYRQLVKTHHPDVGGDEELFKGIQAAYAVLSDDLARADYDKVLAGGMPDDVTVEEDEWDPGWGDPAGTATDAAVDEPVADEWVDVDDHGDDAHTDDVWIRPPVYGEPADDGTFGGRGSVGKQGEDAVATILENLELPFGSYVFHDLTLPNSNANVDHVLVVGDQIIVIDTKTWAPGTYQLVNGECWRDGQRFEPGDASAAMFIATSLAETLGATTVGLMLAIVPSHGPVDGLDLRGYQRTDLTTVRVDQLAGALADVAAASSDAIMTVEVAEKLSGMVRTQRFNHAIPDLGTDLPADLPSPTRGAGPAVKVATALMVAVGACIWTLPPWTGNASFSIGDSFPGPRWVVGVGIVAMIAYTLWMNLIVSSGQVTGDGVDAGPPATMRRAAGLGTTKSDVEGAVGLLTLLLIATIPVEIARGLIVGMSSIFGDAGSFPPFVWLSRAVYTVPMLIMANLLIAVLRGMPATWGDILTAPPNRLPFITQTFVTDPTPASNTILAQLRNHPPTRTWADWVTSHR